MANEDNWWEHPDSPYKAPETQPDPSGWNPNDPYNTPGTPPPDSGDDGLMETNIDENGVMHYGGQKWRVSRAEWNRRWDLNIKLNPNNGDPKPSGGGEVPTPAGVPRSTPFPPQEKYVPAPQDLELDRTIMDGIRDALSGKLLPYNADTIAKMRASSFQAARGQADQAKADLNRDMTRRGLTRSGLAVEQGAAIDRNAGAAVTQGMRDTLVKAATENYKAKADALNRAESYLNQRQQFALSNIRTTQDYQIASAQNTLAWARLRQEWQQLQTQLANALQIAREGNLARMEELFAQMGGR